MKRKLKSLFRIAVMFITVGFIIMIAGLAMGGIGELGREVKDLVHVVRVSVSETVERIPLLERVTNFNGFTIVLNKDDVSVSLNQDYETIQGDFSNLNLAAADEVTSMDISILNGTFCMVPSDNGFFGVKSTGAEKYQCYVSEGTLYLSALPQSSAQDEEAEIVLYVPENCEFEQILLFCSGEQVRLDASLQGESLEISSVLGENICNGVLDFSEITVTAGTGTFSAGELKAEKLKLEVGSASVKMSGMEADDVEVNLGLGDVLLQGRTTGNMDLHCGMGHFEMLLNDSQTAYNYDISGSAESVQIGSDTLAGMMMERWIDNGADKKITMSCGMGSVKIEFTE